MNIYIYITKNLKDYMKLQLCKSRFHKFYMNINIKNILSNNDTNEFKLI